MAICTEKEIKQEARDGLESMGRGGEWGGSEVETTLLSPGYAGRPL